MPAPATRTFAANRREHSDSAADSALGLMLTNMSVLLLAPAQVWEVGVDGGQCMR